MCNNLFLTANTFFCLWYVVLHVIHVTWRQNTAVSPCRIATSTGRADRRCLPASSLYLTRIAWNNAYTIVVARQVTTSCASRCRPGTATTTGPSTTTSGLKTRPTTTACTCTVTAATPATRWRHSARITTVSRSVRSTTTTMGVSMTIARVTTRARGGSPRASSRTWTACTIMKESTMTFSFETAYSGTQYTCTHRFVPSKWWSSRVKTTLNPQRYQIYNRTIRFEDRNTSLIGENGLHWLFLSLNCI